MPEDGKVVMLRENPRMTEFRDLLFRYKDRFAPLLPKMMSVEQLLQLGLVAMGRDSKLLACTPQSVLRGLMVAARYGLDPTGIGGEAWLLPYKNQAQLIVGYKGLLALARRSGLVMGIEAHVVHQNDTFAFEYGVEPRVSHTPVLSGDPGPMIGVYAIVRLKGDEVPMIEWMTKAEIDRIRSRSRASDGPWSTDYEQMSRKSVLRRILNYVPSSTDMKQVMEIEDRQEYGDNPGDISDIMPMPDIDETTGEVPPITKSDEIAQRLTQHTTGEKGGPSQS